MIGKGTSIARTKASMQYGWNHEKDAKVVFKQNLVGDSPRELAKEFKLIQDQNKRCKKNTLSFVLSPTIKDGNRLKRKDFREICERFMKQMKLGERQAVAFVHQDKKHRHIHLYVNRIDFNGKAFPDSYIGKRSQKAAEQVALQLGLKTVKQVQSERLKATKSIRQEIFQYHNESIGKSSNYNQYIDTMSLLGIDVVPSYSSDDVLRGFRYNYQNQSFKGIEVHPSMSCSNLEEEMNNPRKKKRKRYGKNRGFSRNVG